MWICTSLSGNPSRCLNQLTLALSISLSGTHQRLFVATMTLPLVGGSDDSSNILLFYCDQTTGVLYLYCHIIISLIIALYLIILHCSLNTDWYNFARMVCIHYFLHLLSTLFLI